MRRPPRSLGDRAMSESTDGSLRDTSVAHKGVLYASYDAAVAADPGHFIALYRQRIAELEAERDALKAENERLKGKYEEALTLPGELRADIAALKAEHKTIRDILRDGAMLDGDFADTHENRCALALGVLDR